MTLAAPKKPHPSHRQRTGRHQHRHKHFHKPYWPYLPLILIVGIGLLFNSLLPGYGSVLSYATEMSTNQLLTSTNQQRLENGLGKLTIDGKLTNAAQAKAQDMAYKDYWSHNSPSGQTPWSFVLTAGYDYKTAGENLAYGFASSNATVTAWMNSPGHRANILNSSYTDIGFGVIDIADYQDKGNQTLVVAMYGSPQTTTTTQPASPPNSSKPEPQLATAKPEQKAESKPEKTTVKAKQPVKKSDDTLTAQPLQPVDEPKEAPISRIQLVAGNQAAWSVTVTIIILSLALALLLIRHGLAWHKFLVRGERFILKHPVFDFTAVSVMMIAFILSHTAGLIR